MTIFVSRIIIFNMNQRNALLCDAYTGSIFLRQTHIYIYIYRIYIIYIYIMPLTLMSDMVDASLHYQSSL